MSEQRINFATTSQGSESVQRVMARSVTDPEYRQRLLSDPATALREVTGEPLPPNYQIAFIESRADLTLVLPKAAHQVADLNEVDLDTVSGGTSLPVLVSAATAIASAAIQVDKYIQNHWAPTPEVITDEDMENTVDPCILVGSSGY